MKNEIDKLLQKQMDRKDFLRHVAIGFAAIAGITTLAKTISAMSGGNKKRPLGYGASAYGGRNHQTARLARRQG